MPKSYSRDFKKMIVELINIQGHSTLKTAEEFNVPLKTLENWITAFNKDNHCFDSKIENSDFKKVDSLTPSISYDDMSNEELKLQLKF